MRSGRRAPLLVSPCGSGKTVAFSFFAETASAKGKRVLILAHREELIDQISDTLEQFKVKHSFVCAGREYDMEHSVHVGSVFSVVRRMHKLVPPNIIIIDEAHHAIKGSTWGRVLQNFPKAYRVGVTASPARLSGEPLGDIFDDMIMGPTVSELIELGALCKYKLFAPSTIDTSDVKSKYGDFVKGDLARAAAKPVITGHAITEYKKRAAGKRAIVFCVSVEHAKNVAEEFSRAGFRALSIDGTLHGDIRKQIVSDYRSGKIDILTSCDIISEGFDLPAIEVAIMLRPTMSLALWIQQSGRALRPFPGKEYAIILDHAGNAMRHGLPDEDREWSLSGIAKRKGGECPTRSCPKCYAVFFGGLMKCPECGHIFQLEKKREVETVEGDLVEVDVAAVRRVRLKEQGSAQSLEDLYQIGLKRGYRNARAWSKHVFNARQAKKLQRGR
jgi:superfamily II DNA or RNA helicase